MWHGIWFALVMISIVWWCADYQHALPKATQHLVQWRQGQQLKAVYGQYLQDKHQASQQGWMSTVSPTQVSALLAAEGISTYLLQPVSIVDDTPALQGLKLTLHWQAAHTAQWMAQAESLQQHIARPLHWRSCLLSRDAQAGIGVKCEMEWLWWQESSS